MGGDGGRILRGAGRLRLSSSVALSGVTNSIEKAGTSASPS
jgi:hypothetical protein